MKHYGSLFKHISQGWLAAEQKARKLSETQISSTLAQVCIILSICSVTAMGLHITLRIFSFSFFLPGNLFFITSSSCWGPSSWPSRHGNLFVGMQFYKLCGNLRKEEGSLDDKVLIFTQIHRILGSGHRFFVLWWVSLTFSHIQWYCQIPNLPFNVMHWERAFLLKVRFCWKILNLMQIFFSNLLWLP